MPEKNIAEPDSEDELANLTKNPYEPRFRGKPPEVRIDTNVRDLKRLPWFRDTRKRPPADS